MALFPVHYCGSIGYYKALLNADSVVFEVHEHFLKQTHRNRMEILGPNGLQKLIIPTLKSSGRRAIKAVEISYAENWQKDHWKSLEAAYRRSPYFEFFEDRFRPFYQNEQPSLLQLNLDLQALILELIGTTLNFQLSTDYLDQTPNDFRASSFELEQPKTYLQVFSDRHPFTPNLSMLDALFNLGPSAKELLG